MAGEGDWFHRLHPFSPSSVEVRGLPELLAVAVHHVHAGTNVARATALRRMGGAGRVGVGAGRGVRGVGRRGVVVALGLGVVRRRVGLTAGGVRVVALGALAVVGGPGVGVVGVTGLPLSRLTLTSGPPAAHPVAHPPRRLHVIRWRVTGVLGLGVHGGALRPPALPLRRVLPARDGGGGHGRGLVLPVHQRAPHGLLRALLLLPAIDEGGDLGRGRVRLRGLLPLTLPRPRPLASLLLPPGTRGVQTAAEVADAGQVAVGRPARLRVVALPRPVRPEPAASVQNVLRAGAAAGRRLEVVVLGRARVDGPETPVPRRHGAGRAFGGGLGVRGLVRGRVGRGRVVRVPPSLTGRGLTRGGAVRGRVGRGRVVGVPPSLTGRGLTRGGAVRGRVGRGRVVGVPPSLTGRGLTRGGVVSGERRRLGGALAVGAEAVGGRGSLARRLAEGGVVGRPLAGRRRRRRRQGALRRVVVDVHLALPLQLLPVHLGAVGRLGEVGHGGRLHGLGLPADPVLHARVQLGLVLVVGDQLGLVHRHGVGLHPLGVHVAGLGREVRGGFPPWFPPSFHLVHWVLGLVLVVVMVVVVVVVSGVVVVTSVRVGDAHVAAEVERYGRPVPPATLLLRGFGAVRRGHGVRPLTWRVEVSVLAAVAALVSGTVPVAGPVRPRESLVLVRGEVTTRHAAQRGRGRVVTRRVAALLGLVVEVLVVPGFVLSGLLGAPLRVHVLPLLLVSGEEDLVRGERVGVRAGSGGFRGDGRSAGLRHIPRFLGASRAREFLHHAVAQLVERGGGRLGGRLLLLLLLLLWRVRRGLSGGRRQLIVGAPLSLVPLQPRLEGEVGVLLLPAVLGVSLPRVVHALLAWLGLLAHGHGGSVQRLVRLFHRVRVALEVVVEVAATVLVVRRGVGAWGHRPVGEGGGGIHRGGDGGGAGVGDGLGLVHVGRGGGDGFG